MAVTQALTVIRGRYRLETLIGEGGMAAIWRAKDLTLARPVAVKLLFERDERDHEGLVQRFLREARIAAAVQHRNVIHIVDFGTTEDGQPFMVMELLEGENLGDRLHREGRLSVPEVVHTASMTLRGLAAVHDAGIIHRDLKPDNIYLKEEGGVVYPKILDFGISRSLEPASGRRSALTTREGIIVGTPEYMSPEQARGLKDIDRRTDIYSMGVILYQALTGKLPFSSENVGDLIIQIVTSATPRANELDPEITQALSDVIARAMARRPEDRFADAGEMQRALITAAESSIGDTLRRSLSDMAPFSSAAEDLPRIPRDKTLLSREFSLAPGLAAPGKIPSPPPPLGTPPAPSAAPLTTDDFLAAYQEPKRSKRAWALGAIGAALAIAAYAAWSRDTEVVTRPAAVVPQARVAAAQPPPPPAPVLPKTIQVIVNGLPDDATLAIDGQPVVGSQLELERNDEKHVLLARTRGKSWQTEFVASADQTFDAVLVDDPKPTRSPAAAKVKRPPRTKAPSALRDVDF